MDVLSDLLARARAHGALFSDSSLVAPWGIEFLDELPVSVHAVIEGEMVVEADGEAPVRALQGDLLLIRHDRPYRFVHREGAPARPLAAYLEEAGKRAGRVFLADEGDGPRTHFVCGAYTFDGALCDELLAALPPVAVLRGGQNDPALRAALALLVQQLHSDVPGQQAALDRLLDLLLVLALRAWFADAAATPPGWWAALGDHAIGAALQAIHDTPSHPWTVAELAGRAGLSRAAFSRRFTAAVGRSPLDYLIHWRMELAKEALLRPGTTVAMAAAEVGYGNEFAFATAFKKRLGVAPGQWRRARAA